MRMVKLRILKFLANLSGVLFVLLSLHLPLSIYATASHDDGFFISKGYSIISGQWLGDFNNLTLIKGPVYSIFLALNSLIGIPITITTALVFILMVVFAARVMAALGLNKTSILLLSILLFLNPAYFPTRVIRDNLYFVLTVVVLLSILLQFVVESKKGFDKFTFIYGLCFGVFWSTREEGVWLIPSIFIAMAYGFYYVGDGNRVALSKKLALYLGSALLVIVAISSINYAKYGQFAVVDFKAKGFVGALDALNSIDVGEEQLYLPVPSSKREVAYSVSPSFMQLKEYFDGPGRGWTEHGCRIYTNTCGDYAGGWFMWALRDAAQYVGKYDSAQGSENFYRAIKDEILNACKSSKIACREKTIPFLPIITIENLKLVPKKIWDVLAFSANMGDVKLTEGRSSGDEGSLNKAQRFLGNPRRTLTENEEIHTYKGWYISTQGDWIKLKCGDDGLLHQILRVPSSDLVNAFKRSDLNRNRFDFSLKSTEGCKIINDDGDDVYTFSSVKNIADENGKRYQIHFDSIKNSPEQLYYEEALKIKLGLIKIFSVIMPILGSVGFISLLNLLFKICCGQLKLNQLSVASICLWTAFFTRCLLMLLVDISSFPAIYTMYLLPAIILLTFASVLTVCAVMEGSNDSFQKSTDI